jgi:hypothetical protein
LFDTDSHLACLPFIPTTTAQVLPYITSKLLHLHKDVSSKVYFLLSLSSLCKSKQRKEYSMMMMHPFYQSKVFLGREQINFWAGWIGEDVARALNPTYGIY